MHYNLLCFLKNLVIGVFIMIGSLEHLINVFSATEWFWYGIAIFGLIIMRLTLPDEHRPFKVFTSSARAL